MPAAREVLHVQARTLGDIAEGAVGGVRFADVQARLIRTGGDAGCAYAARVLRVRSLAADECSALGARCSRLASACTTPQRPSRHTGAARQRGDRKRFVHYGTRLYCASTRPRGGYRRQSEAARCAGASPMPWRRPGS